MKNTHTKKKLFKDLILVLIYQSSGKWTWYQIARELGFRGIGGRVNIAKIIGELLTESLIKESKSSNETDVLVYEITEEGTEKVLTLVSEYGPEAFACEIQNPDDYI